MQNYLTIQDSFQIPCKNMRDIAAEGQVNFAAHREACGCTVGRDDDDDFLPFCRNVQMHARTHKLAHIDLTLDTVFAQRQMVGTDTEDNILRLNVLFFQSLLLFFALLYRNASDFDRIGISVVYELCI